MNNHFDYRWLLLLLLVPITITLAILLNLIKDQDKSSIATVARTIMPDNGDLKINWNRYQTYDIKLSESQVITTSGIYHLTGNLENGNITVNAGPEGVVKLVLDNVSISNSSGPAIYCKDGEDLVIELIGDNNISDGVGYSSSFDEDVTGAIYSKADLTFQGDGSLNLTANYQDAVVGKDDLKFASGTYKINSNDDAIRGKDSVYIVNGDFTIDAGADAIKSTNIDTIGKGFVLIENGNFNLTTGAKGIKSTNNLIIKDGDFAINSNDDSIHCDNYVGISNGTITINSADDAIHANSKLLIDNGNLTISKSYEGLEAQTITINGGNIRINSSDDGINAGGGADSSSTNRVDANAFDADEKSVIAINNGNIYINSSGDGIDSNGWLYFNGGDTIVDGPSNNGNGALDAGMGIVMNGGKVIALGSSGMAESLGANSSINNISVFFDSTIPANTLIEIKDSSNSVILSHTTQKPVAHLAAGTDHFTLGNTYTIYINNEKYRTFTISDITTSIGNMVNNQNNADPSASTRRPNDPMVAPLSR